MKQTSPAHSSNRPRDRPRDSTRDITRDNKRDSMVELDQLNIHSSRDIIARHGLTLPELFNFSLEFYKEGYCQYNLNLVN